MALAVAVLVCTSCITTAGSATITRPSLVFTGQPTPSKTGWWLLETPEFALTTDLPASQAQEAAQLIAQTLTGLRTLFDDTEPQAKRRLEVFAFADSLAYEQRFGPRLDGMLLGKAEQQAMVMLHGPPARWAERVFVDSEIQYSPPLRLLATAVIAQYFRRQPRWFFTGLSLYLETIRWVSPTVIRFGDPNLGGMHFYEQNRVFSIEQMKSWAVGATQADLLAMAGLSWAFVYWLMNTHPQALKRYMALLDQQGEEVAWLEAFGELTGVDEDLYKFIRARAYRYTQATIGEGSVTPAGFRPLTEEEFARNERLFDVLSRGTKPVQ
jgi:hypothetical protein